ncbi:PIF-3 [Chrysodeixis includens nucleopolyhedrovirus]|uniref:PIF-3 n=1 Tax=Chrysodeixis includens nucleopolyhedrovirus TaxID=1207438 RepID=A0A5B8YU06_9ABAC|nr:PIF-3 [Chrysodeixis includens nucleopolyhedrovirus]QED40621.1 PIF-3 [Chrysodeixis includens nucleopolyhedrovirus]
MKVLMTVNIFFIIISLLIICFYSLNLTNYVMTEQIDEIENDAINSLEFVFQRNGLVDCSHTKIICVNDRQCKNNCALSAFNYVCDNGFCNVQDPKVSGQAVEDINCDSKLGLMKVFAASEFAVKQMCISMYRDIVDDQGTLRPYFCEPGSVKLDLANTAFFIEDCRCSDSHVKMIFNQTALARTIPVCIPKTQINLYNKIYSTA